MQLLTIVLIELLRSTSTLSSASASPYPDGSNNDEYANGMWRCGGGDARAGPPHAVPDLKYAVPAISAHNQPAWNGILYRLVHLDLLRSS